MSSPLDQKLCQEIQELFEQGVKQPVAAWNSIYQLLEKNNLAYTHKLTVDQVLVHPDNRAKLGVNAHQAHKTGSMIFSIGADLAELKKYVLRNEHERGYEGGTGSFQRQPGQFV